MAAGTGFKQQCPSCEAMVPIRDPKLIGRKIDCPKCKYRFVVEEPEPEPEEDLDDVVEAEDEAPKKPVKKGKEPVAPVKGKNGVAKKPAARPKAEEEDDGDEVDEEEEEQPRAKGKPAAVKAKAPAAKGKKADAEADEEEDGAKKGDKKKKKDKKKKDDSKNKMLIGVALAGVGVVALGVAAYFMFFNKKDSNTPGRTTPGGTMANNPGGNQGKPAEKKPDPAVGAKVAPPSAELTNLLLNKTDHVAQIHFGEIWDSPLGNVILKNFSDEEFKARVGIPLRSIDEVIRSQSFRDDWAYNLVHTSEPFDFEMVKKTLGVGKPVTVNDQDYYLTTGDNPWLDALGRLSLGRPTAPTPGRKGPIAVHEYNAQTLVFADEVAMKLFLAANRKPEQKKPEAKPAEKEEKKGNPMGGTPNPMGGANIPMGKGSANPNIANNPNNPNNPNINNPNAGQKPAQEKPAEKKADPSAVQQSYFTIDARLRDIFVKLDKPEDSKERVLFRTATLRRAAAGKPRQFWDITWWMTPEPPGVEVVGSSLRLKDELTYTYVNGLNCRSEDGAKDLHKGLEDTVGPDFAKFLTQLTGISVKVIKEKKKEEESKDQNTGNPNPTLPISPKGGTPQGGGSLRPPMPMGGGSNRPMNPNPKGGGGALIPPMPNNPNAPKDESKKEKEEEEKDGTGLRISRSDNFILLTLVLVLEEDEKKSLERLGGLVVGSLKGELDLAAVSPGGGRPEVFRLGAAVKKMGEEKKEFPPAALPRPEDAKRNNYPWEPDKRVSWMVELLPYLGHQTLYNSIDKGASWDDPRNLVAAHTLVPEFLDPSYPATSRYVRYGRLPVSLAATHFVGVGGVGEDIAAESDQDAGAVKRRGLLRYDQATPLSALKRKSSHTALLIQVPPDGAGPWMAGGGSTVRGIPANGSIKPFVSGSSPKAGRGTLVLMADGSVRFVSEKISPEAFKAMCTLEGQGDPKEDEWEAVAPAKK